MESLASFDLETICSYLTYDAVIHLKLSSKMMFQLLRGVDANLKNILIECLKTRDGKYWQESKAQESYKYIVRPNGYRDFWLCDILNIAIMTKDMELFVVANREFGMELSRYFTYHLANTLGSNDISVNDRECFDVDKKCIKQDWLDGFTYLCKTYPHRLYKFAFAAQCSLNQKFYNVVLEYQRISTFKRNFD